MNREGGDYAVIHSFGTLLIDGLLPFGSLHLGDDGRLYGTTLQGGIDGEGTVFGLNPDGSDFQVLHSFSFRDGNGYGPVGGLTQGSDGTLVGTTYNYGTIFKINKDGTDFAVLHQFSGPGSEGRLIATDGVFWGAINESGTVFSIASDGTDFRTVRRFSSNGVGMKLGRELARDDLGTIYGTLRSSAQLSSGLLFALHPGEDHHEVLHEFGTAPGDGVDPAGGVSLGQDGMIYGSTTAGGLHGFGTAYRLNQNGTGYTILHHFSNADGDGGTPEAGPVEVEGLIFGTTRYLGAELSGTVYVIDPGDSGYSVIARPTTWGEGAAFPRSRIVQTDEGRLFSTASTSSSGHGEILRFSTNAAGFTVIGSLPERYGFFRGAPLTKAADGFLYGTTYDGGNGFGPGPDSGNVFRIRPTGSGFEVIHNFKEPTGLEGDGTGPLGRLIQADDGAIYGTTSSGGLQHGTIFRLDPGSLDYAVLHRFGQANDRATYPMAGLIQASDGRLYGTTSRSRDSNNGTVFRLDLNGTGYEIIHVFLNGSDVGSSPRTALIERTEGLLYGTTLKGGVGLGAIFRIKLDGSEYLSVHTFGDEPLDGHHPSGDLLKGGDGNLYGTTFGGGKHGLGVVFRLSGDGDSYSVIHHFTGADGAHPEGGLMQAADGAFYGVTPYGGIGGVGTIFSLSPVLRPLPNEIVITPAVQRVLVRFMGVPQTEYVFQSAPDAGGPFTDLLPVQVADNTGLISFTESILDQTGRVYRVRTNP